MGRISEGEAENALDNGALGIGENHEDPAGRNLAIRLIKTGKVRMLMVELSEGAYDGMIQLATGKRADGFDAVKASMLTIANRHNCTVSLADVIACAICAGIPVYNVDHYIANARAEVASNATNMEKRNAHAAGRFNTLTGGNDALGPGAKGCLILFGGAHFEGPSSLDSPNKIDHLPVVMMG